MNGFSLHGAQQPDVEQRGDSANDLELKIVSESNLPFPGHTPSKKPTGTPAAGYLLPWGNEHVLSHCL